MGRANKLIDRASRMSYLKPQIPLCGLMGVQDQDDDYFGCISSSLKAQTQHNTFSLKSWLLRKGKCFINNFVYHLLKVQGG